jgi:hypothetical protein
MQKENAALWKAKPLLTKLVGDNIWAPCGLMTAPDDRDALLFTDTMSYLNRPTRRVAGVNGYPKAPGGTSTDPAQREVVGQGERPAPQPVNGSEQSQDPDETLPDAPTGANGVDGRGGEESGAPQEADKDKKPNGNPSEGADKDGLSQADGGEDAEMAEAPSNAGPSTAAAQPNPSTVPSLLDAQAASSPAGAGQSTADDEPFIHPLFLPPPAAHPDRDLGLPEQEAEEVRRLLLLYVQKQEEICRGTTRLYEGLLRADRYRNTVWRWAKAEAHCRPGNREMSDGEDWYDKEEWGLTEDLKKGEDEVEEETATQTQQKKTRNRK